MFLYGSLVKNNPTLVHNIPASKISILEDSKQVLLAISSDLFKTLKVLEYRFCLRKTFTLYAFQSALPRARTARMGPLPPT